MTSTTAPAPSSDLPTTARLLERIREDWAQLRPELDPQPMLTVLLLDRLHSALSRRIEQTYFESDINASNWDLLLTLLRSAPPEGLTPSELSQLSAISGASITNRVARLLDKKLVERVVSAQDRRSAQIRLTPTGRALTEKLLTPHVENETQVLSVLSQEEQRTLERLALKLVSHLERQTAQE
ncbi:MarR family transcriptional regulator [Deinococcus detaillensis]|uniref:MarR family transcriptional regulator n=1 Tax=Deinococcus detaillensis TaxID=2592048 RepID=A0A553V4L8_9DEIO|nr:MarR family transcriptional regulator [Deinococcus detaillensis]TSA87409.1 MarR family transcriptional regulator [Deinococcus detaillensis]